MKSDGSSLRFQSQLLTKAEGDKPKSNKQKFLSTMHLAFNTNRIIEIPF